MRNVVLCLAAAVLVAGCTQAATPSASTSPTASNPPPPGGPGPHGGTLVVPPHGENVTDGLRLEGAADRSGIDKGGTVRLDYTVRNEGADATTRGACERPYAFTLRDANGTAHPLQVPMAHCLALSFDPFPAGATLAFNTTWDGTYAEGDHLVQAPPGAYRFTATFTAARPGQAAVVALTLPLNILSQPGMG
ncbi:MAG: hypothetical protein QOI63_1567 [Thermoplasmata archaeon]|jgi:hypothetical protein|nr:hypothetical protein [Thermoplasmata archaeon]